MRRFARALAVAWGVGVIALPAGALPPPDVAPGVAIAVAPFERNAPPGADVPEVDALLADRLGTKGVTRIVGPRELGVDPQAEPTDEVARGWAERAEVTAIVVGRVTRIGNQFSVDVRLRSGETGAVISTYVAEILQTGALEATVDRLAGQILDGVRDLGGVTEGAVAAAAPVAPASPQPAATNGNEPFGIRFDSGRPVTIRADELEAISSDGARRLLFTKNVVVTQDDVTIRSARLEAFYPPNTSQPDRLLAQGRVRMTQGDSEARCDQATFERAKDLLICRGNAELRDGEDCVAGERIEFDLAAETVKVKGGARVVIGGQDGAASGGCQ